MYNFQVVREVAVLDNINPGGMYASRVKMLGRYESVPESSSSDTTEWVLRLGILHEWVLLTLLEDPVTSDWERGAGTCPRPWRFQGRPLRGSRTSQIPSTMTTAASRRRSACALLSGACRPPAAACSAT